jgi:hypothetical protein
MAVPAPHAKTSPSRWQGWAVAVAVACLACLAGPVAAVASGDDRQLYVVASTDSAIVVLRRLASTQIFQDGFEATQP